MVLNISNKALKSLRHMANGARKLLKDERGEFVSTIGWMAIVATVLVLVHGLITGWLPDFINRIFDRLDTLV